MSRIGRKPVEVPSGVSVQIDDRSVAVEGAMGKLQWGFPVGIEVGFDESSRLIEVKRRGDETQARAFHGLTRSLIQNMVTGVVKGFEKRLEIVGVGYQAQLKGDSLEVSVVGRSIGRLVALLGCQDSGSSLYKGKSRLVYISQEL